MKTKITLLATLIMIAVTLNSLAQTQNKHQKRHFNVTANNNSAFKTLLNDYTFSMNTGTYTNLVNSTPIINSEGPLWNDPVSIIPIGFTFKYYDTYIDSLYMDGSGACLKTDSSEDGSNFIFPFETDLKDRGCISGTPQSPITYKVEGNVGNRIFKLEWKNAGFENEDWELETLNDYVNIQLWLFEGTNNIEMHYGPNSIIHPDIDYEDETGAIIGIADYYGTNPYFLTGPANNPVINDTTNIHINGTPANGTIYKFTKNINGINEPYNIINNIFPNPVNNNLTINFSKNFNNADIKLINTTRQTILENKINGQQKIIDMSKLNSGIYFLKIETADNNTIIRKIIKE